MNNIDPWLIRPLPATSVVPESYRGVWLRSVLETPEHRDTTTFVCWMQLAHWHADLRIPADRARLAFADCNAQQRAIFAQQKGFSGLTNVHLEGDLAFCTWHRLVDYHPPEPQPDVGRMAFESADCVVETGVHETFREVWNRLPDSTSPLIALAESGSEHVRLFIAGRYLIRVKPSQIPSPDFEISMGELAAGQWHIQHSTLPELEGRSLGFAISRSTEHLASVELDGTSSEWWVIEWVE